MIASNKLKARMTEMGLTQREVAHSMGMSTQSLSYKLNGHTEFKVSEIDALCAVLEIEERDAYFFAEK